MITQSHIERSNQIEMLSREMSSHKSILSHREIPIRDRRALTHTNRAIGFHRITNPHMKLLRGFRRQTIQRDREQVQSQTRPGNRVNRSQVIAFNDPFRKPLCMCELPPRVVPTGFHRRPDFPFHSTSLHFVPLGKRFHTETHIFFYKNQIFYRSAFLDWGSQNLPIDLAPYYTSIFSLYMRYWLIASS